MIKKFNQFNESNKYFVDNEVNEENVRRGSELICKKDKSGDLKIGDEYVVNNISWRIWTPFITLEGFDGEYPLSWFEIKLI